MKKRDKKKLLRVALSIIAVTILALTGYFYQENQIEISKQENTYIQSQEDKQCFSFQESEDNLEIYFIDVGQADSILIRKNDNTMLIDGGNNTDGELVVNFLKEHHVTSLNYIIGTHPHEDHIGGLDNVINNFPVEHIFMPKVQTNTKTFEDVLDAVANKNLSIETPKIEETFDLGDVKGTMLSIEKNTKKLNLSSIVVRLHYQNQSFLFMGDAEKENEQKRTWPKTNILKVGHHGSDTSTSEDFLKQISPKIAVFSVGSNNKYGHPKQEILDLLQKYNVKLYRTDQNGTIMMKSDGNSIEVKTEK